MEKYSFEEMMKRVISDQKDEDAYKIDPQKIKELEKFVPERKPKNKKRFWAWVTAPACLVLALIITLTIVLNLPKPEEKRYSDVLNCESVRIEKEEVETILPQNLTFISEVFNDCILCSALAYQYEGDNKAINLNYEENADIPPFTKIELVVTFTKQFLYSEDDTYRKNLIEETNSYKVYKSIKSINSKEYLIMLISANTSDIYFMFDVNDNAIAEKYLVRMKNFL